MIFGGRSSSFPPLGEICAVIEAALFLAAARLAIHLLPFRQIARFLAGGTAGAQDDAARRQALLVGRAMTRAVRRLPFKANCLPQAMAAHAMLRRRGVGCVVHFGVRKSGGLIAHAWIEAAGQVVTGDDQLDSFSPIARSDHF